MIFPKSPWKGWLPFTSGVNFLLYWQAYTEKWRPKAQIGLFKTHAPWRSLPQLLIWVFKKAFFVRDGEMAWQSRAALAEALGWVLGAYMAVLNCHSSSGAPILLSSLGIPDTHVVLCVHASKHSSIWNKGYIWGGGLKIFFWDTFAMQLQLSSCLSLPRAETGMLPLYSAFILTVNRVPRNQSQKIIISLWFFSYHHSSNFRKMII